MAGLRQKGRQVQIGGSHLWQGGRGVRFGVDWAETVVFDDRDDAADVDPKK